MASWDPGLAQDLRDELGRQEPDSPCPWRFAAAFNELAAAARSENDDDPVLDRLTRLRPDPRDATAAEASSGAVYVLLGQVLSARECARR